MRTLVGLLHETMLFLQDAAPQAAGVGAAAGPPGPPPGFSPIEAATHFIEFIGDFLAVGSIGFRYGIVRRVRGMTDEARMILRADNAATLGIIGVLLLALTVIGIPVIQGMLDGKTIAQTLPKTPSRLYFRLAMLTVALVGFLIVRAKPSTGWALALLGVVFAVLQPLYTGKLAGKVNAVHVLAASTWLGTLLVMSIVGIRGVARRNPVGAERSRVVADLVNSFSPLALTAATILALTGLTTAWLHLKRISALYTTSYGITLVVKLLLVLCVVALGAWNWKKIRPTLGDEGTEDIIRRSSTMELTFGGLVLIATAILVTLPSPR